MSLLFQGILTGIVLSFMIGPLLFAIIQASLERGFRAGFSIGVGIWLSDILFIILIYQSLGWISSLTSSDNFQFYAGLFGGTVLVAFGLGSILFLKKNPGFKNLDTSRLLGDKALDCVDGEEPTGVKNNWKNWGNLGYFFRGFFLNSFNPFTVFFWLGITTTTIIPNNWNIKETLIFFGGMMGMLVLTDTLKALGAKKIKDKMTPNQISKVKFWIGLILIGIGLFAYYRTFTGDWGM